MAIPCRLQPHTDKSTCHFFREYVFTSSLQTSDSGKMKFGNNIFYWSFFIRILIIIIIATILLDYIADVYI